jgi:hypothetical protein
MLYALLKEENAQLWSLKKMFQVTTQKLSLRASLFVSSMLGYSDSYMRTQAYISNLSLQKLLRDNGKVWVLFGASFAARWCVREIERLKHVA